MNVVAKISLTTMLQTNLLRQDAYQNVVGSIYILYEAAVVKNCLHSDVRLGRLDSLLKRLPPTCVIVS